MGDLSTYEEALKAWNLAGFKDGMIFSWIISEHKDICLELLQLILPDLGIVDVKNIKKKIRISKIPSFTGLVLISMLKTSMDECMILGCRSVMNII